MNTASQSELETLAGRLQEALTQSSPLLQLQIRCAIKQNTLLILIEHLLHVEPNPQTIFTELERSLSVWATDLASLMQSIAENSQVLPVRMYLRIVGYQQPYASHTFNIEPSPSLGLPDLEAAAPEVRLSDLPQETPSLETAPLEQSDSDISALPFVADTVSRPDSDSEPEAEPSALGKTEPKAFIPDTPPHEAIEPVESEPIESQAIAPELIEPQAIEPQAIEASETETVESQAIETEQIEPIESEQIEPQAIELEPIEPELIESELIEPSETQAIEPEPIEPQVIEPQAIEPELIEPQAIEASESELIESETIEPELIEPIELEAIETIEPVELEAIETENIEPQAIESEPIETIEASETETIEPEPIEPIEPELVESEPIETIEASETETIESQAIEPEPSETQAIEAIEPQAIEPEPIETELIETTELEAIEPELIETIEPEPIEPQAIETIESQAIETELIEPSETETIEPQAIETEPSEPQVIEAIEPQAIESDAADTDATEPDATEPAALIGREPIVPLPTPESVAVESIASEDFFAASEPVPPQEANSQQESIAPYSLPDLNSPSFDAAEANPELATNRPESLPPDPVTLPLESTISEAPPAVTPPPHANDPAQQEAIAHSPRRSRLSPSTLMLGGAVGLFVLVSGLYVLTRPCVLGTQCEPLQKAQQLNQQANQTIETTDSALKVIEAYDQLTEASFLLGTIPAWSSQYQAAQTLQASYEGKSKQLGQVVKALKQANAAAQKSQNPPHPLQEWRQIQWNWREAIATLEKVSPDSAVAALAQKKLKEYQANLANTDQRVIAEQNAQDKVTTARNTAKVAETRAGVANSSEGWQQVYLTWDAAINILQQIPQGTMAHSEAQQLLSIYQPKKAEADNRRNQERVSSDSFQQATTLATQARNFEQQNQWTQAVANWRNALANMQQIPQGTSYYTQAQPLLNEYQTALAQAEENLRRTTALQAIQPNLNRTCAGNPKVCTYTLSPAAIRVQMTAGYDRAVENAITSAQVRGNVSDRAEVVNQVNTLLQRLAEISETAQVPIELYNSNGSKFGTYAPDVSGFVSR
jgi:hypothetical protein